MQVYELCCSRKCLVVMIMSGLGWVFSEHGWVVMCRGVVSCVGVCAISVCCVVLWCVLGKWMCFFEGCVCLGCVVLLILCCDGG